MSGAVGARETRSKGPSLSAGEWSEPGIKRGPMRRVDREV